MFETAIPYASKWDYTWGILAWNFFFLRGPADRFYGICDTVGFTISEAILNQ